MEKLIVANWKENPASLKEAVSLVRQIEKGISKANKNEVVIAAPFPFLLAVKEILKHAKLGAQNVFWEDGGAYTSEVSPSMLKNSGVEYVIIGHSERRRLGETDEMINKKIIATIKAGLKPILCVGEHFETRKRGLAAAKNFVKDQLKKDLKNLPTTHYPLLTSRLIVAYEPIWAISTNKNAHADKPEDSLEMIRFIKSFLASKPYTLNPRVLYGGSVTSRNAKSFLQYKEIDGALVGGASLKAEEFKKIIRNFM
ncbi:MAG: triose-phosphate isomerase [Candidatus Liptonbacteria bacterium]|nr:triose-phosphate isomerase [Candidatus Liptonbacteria bacterium]